ncbi:MAG: NUDIX domain-containing protein [Clostridia bacterium]|nr:NUDIX domain-containing protein [Clostridia bacterium]
MAELWDIYNENREKTGETIERGGKRTLKDGEFHLVVHVWIKNSEGKYLISQRSASRPTFPLEWECVGGSVTAGEDSLTGALRETLEEVGITLDPEKGSVVFTKIRRVIGGKPFRDILDVWLFEYDGDADLTKATTPDEVSDVRWMSKDEIKALYNEGKFVRNLVYFFSDIAN